MGGGTFTDWRSLIYESLDMVGTKLNASWTTIATCILNCCCWRALCNSCCCWSLWVCLMLFRWIDGCCGWHSLNGPGRITGDDKDCPARLKLINNSSLKIKLGRIPWSAWQAVSSPMARLGQWEGGQVGKWMNSLLFQLDFKRVSQNQVSSMIHESLKIRVSQSWLLAAIVWWSVSHDQISHVDLVWNET